MAEKRQVVTFEELVMSVMYEQETSSVSPFLANLTCHLGEEGLLRGAIYNRGHINNRRVVYAIKGVTAKLEPPPFSPRLRGKAASNPA